jgi:hypothetical protein
MGEVPPGRGRGPGALFVQDLDEDDSLEVCRMIADLARQQGYHAILSPSAALAGSVNLNLYLDGRADHDSLDVGPDRIAVTAELLLPYF